MYLSRKRVRIGFIVILFLMILPVLIAGTRLSALNVIGNGVSSLSEKDKLEFLKLEEYKRLGITTIEEFDSFWKNKVAKPSFPIYMVLPPIIILLGCVLFYKVAYWFLILYSSYRLFYAISSFLDKDATQFNRVGNIYAVILFLICIIYLILPSVKNNFIKKGKSTREIK